MENAKVDLRQGLLLLLLLLTGWLIRLYDLDDPPLDFHPTRQLFSALKARGILRRASRPSATLAGVYPFRRRVLRASFNPYRRLLKGIGYRICLLQP
ncbi:MAG: hypothetical protein WHS87_11110 [Anaerolineales bacterium]